MQRAHNINSIWSTAYLEHYEADVSGVGPLSGRICDSLRQRANNNLFYGVNLALIKLFNAKFSCFDSSPTWRHSKPFIHITCCSVKAREKNTMRHWLRIWFSLVEKVARDRIFTQSLGARIATTWFLFILRMIAFLFVTASDTSCKFAVSERIRAGFSVFIFLLRGLSVDFEGCAIQRPEIPAIYTRHKESP